MQRFYTSPLAKTGVEKTMEQFSAMASNAQQPYSSVPFI